MEKLQMHSLAIKKVLRRPLAVRLSDPVLLEWAGQWTVVTAKVEKKNVENTNRNYEDKMQCKYSSSSSIHLRKVLLPMVAVDAICVRTLMIDIYIYIDVNDKYDHNGNDNDKHHIILFISTSRCVYHIQVQWSACFFFPLGKSLHDYGWYLEQLQILLSKLELLTSLHVIVCDYMYHKIYITAAYFEFQFRGIFRGRVLCWCPIKAKIIFYND